jgi:hypothetical protein
MMPEHPRVVGSRPQAWWRFEAERPDHLTDEPDWLDYIEGREMTDEERDRYGSDYVAWEHEPIVWMAAHGHLTDDELAMIEQTAEEAERRIDTDEEGIASGDIYDDRAAVELARRVGGLTTPPSPGGPGTGAPDG